MFEHGKATCSASLAAPSTSLQDDFMVAKVLEEYLGAGVAKG